MFVSAAWNTQTKTGHSSLLTTQRRRCVWDLLETPLQPHVLPPVSTSNCERGPSWTNLWPPEPASNHIDTNVGWCLSFSSIKKVTISFILRVEKTIEPGCHTSLCLSLEILPDSVVASMDWMYDKYLYNNKKPSFVKSSCMPFSQKRFSCSCESERKTVDLGLNWLHNYTIKSTQECACTLRHTRKRIHDSHECVFQFLFILRSDLNLCKWSKRVWD